jgi:ankyrin repeat protein
MNAFLPRLLHPQITRIAAVLLITLVWSSLAFCGEIHDAAEKGDLAKAKALLKNNPELVSSKNNAGFNPLYYAARDGYKDVAELLLANKAEVNAKHVRLDSFAHRIITRPQGCCGITAGSWRRG